MVLDAKLAIFIEVGHVGEGVDNEAEERVDRGDVPDDGPVHADQNNREKNGRADPLDNMEDGQQQEGCVVNLRRFLRVVKINILRTKSI